MATTITKSIGTGGGRDYASITAWVAAMPASLVTADEVWIGELYNDAEIVESSAISITKTTDATRYIHLRCAAGHSFKDHASKATNPQRYDQSYGAAVSLGANNVTAINITSPYTIFEGVQFKHTLSPGTGASIYLSSGSATNFTMRNCILENHGSGMTANSALFHTDGNSTTLINSLLIIRTSTAGQGVRASSNLTVSLYNCTLVALSGSSSDGFSFANTATPNNRLVKNCAVFGFGSFANIIGQYHASSGYNATDAASALGGSGNVTGLTFANQFENITTGGSHDLRVKSGSSLVAGTRDQTNTSDLDIVGSSRSTSTPTIGAWEYAVAASGGNNRRLLLGVG